MERRFFDTSRLVSLTDGVAAISMTLLALKLSVPVVKEIQGSEGLWPEIRGLWREMLAYFLSFFIIALLWAYNHTVFRQIKKGNGTLLFLDMLYLLALSLMPFASALVANNFDERLAAIIYGGVLFLAAGANAAMFAYASWKRRLVDPDLEAGFIRRENRIAVWILVIVAAGAGLGYFQPWLTYVVLGGLVAFYWVSVVMGREGLSARRS